MVVPLTRPAGAGHPLPLGEGLAEYIFKCYELINSSDFFFSPYL